MKKKVFLFAICFLAIYLKIHAADTYYKTLQVGETLRISAVRPGYGYAFANSYKNANTSVASVSTEIISSYREDYGSTTRYWYRYEFVVTGLKSGITTINIGLEDSGRFTGYATYIITVIDVKSISIQSEVHLYLGTCYKVPVTILEQGADARLTWKSANPSVASVSSDGTICGNSIGETTVTCTAYNGISATCSVYIYPYWVTSITINHQDCWMYEGDKVYLAATVLPEDATIKQVKWSSSNPNIATVDQEGVVTGVSAGECDIYATATDGSGVRGVSKAHVSKRKVVATSVSFDQTSVEMRKGEEQALKVTILPNNTSNTKLTWTSSNPDVASVSEGVVTAVNPGQAVITATTTDGSNLSATCNLTVLGDDSFNTLSLSDVTIAKGAFAVLPIAMTNEKEIVAMQFELELPEGISVVTNGNNQIVASLSNRSDNHTLSSSELANGNCQFVVLAIPTKPFKGNEGTVVNVQLKTNSTLELGSYIARVKNIELTMQEESTLSVLKPSDAQSTLTVTDVLLGDVNGDGMITVTDAASVVNHILQKAPQGFIPDAADVNGDGAITVTDAASIVNMILSGN